MMEPDPLPRPFSIAARRVQVGDVDQFRYDIVKLNGNASALEGEDVGLY